MDEQIPCLLSESLDITPIISYPLQCTQRIKYTCFDISKGFLVFGATSGGLYVFNRDPCSFVQLIPNKEGAITQIKISPDEKRVSFATCKGSVCVCDCGDAGSGSYVRAPMLQCSKEHQGNEVTAMVWNKSGSELYIGDDTGTVSVLHLSNFITKNVFQTSAFSLMHLDSRIVQFDLKENLLLISTLTRCFICDTIREQYRQIGQKLRDGEFGGCFFYTSKEEIPTMEIPENPQKRDKAFDAVEDGEQIDNCDSLKYIKVFSARPGSRFWEVQIDGTVICTHQFKQLLATPPTKVVTLDDFDTENFDFESKKEDSYPAQSLNFGKIYLFLHKFIFTYKKDGIYIFDPKHPSVVLWTDKYSDIVDCKIVDASIYLWLANGNIVSLSFSTVEKFLLKCFVNQKYKLCARVCALHLSPIMTTITQYKKIYLLSGLGEKLQDCSEHDLYDKISPVLEEIGKIKRSCGQKLKSGIFVVDNSYLVKAASQEDHNIFDENNTDSHSKASSEDSDSMLFQISPDAIQAIKGFSNTFSDKLSSGTRSLKKTWDHLEDKMKKIGIENTIKDPLDVRTNRHEEPDITLENNKNIPQDSDDIVVKNYKNQSKSSFEKESSPKVEKVTKTIYHHVKLSEINKLDNSDTIYSLFANITCDINYVLQIIKEVEEYMIMSGDSPEYSAYHCGKVLLQYISKTPSVDDAIDSVIENEDVCSYFLQAFVNINSNVQQSPSCNCGYPIPNSYSSQIPLFSKLIDIFIEKRWNSSHSDQCYDICKKVPYMWRKILLLRKNEDLLNILLLILQMLDEDLLYSYLPQFTVVTWERAIRLLSTLKNNQCLNCGMKFQCTDKKIIENNMLSWDAIGSLIIKSVGCKNASHILKSCANLIPIGELTIKFYHTCIFVKLFEKFDSTVATKLVDTIYEAYNFEDAVTELTKHLDICLHNDLLHTALPMVVASKSHHWGLKVCQSIPIENDIESSMESKLLNQPDLLQNLTSFPSTSTQARKLTKYEIGMNLEQTLDFIEEICPNKNCLHCCLPLQSRVLVADEGLWVFSCGHTFHGVCLTILKIKLCPVCYKGR